MKNCCYARLYYYILYVIKLVNIYLNTYFQHPVLKQQMTHKNVLHC